MRLAALGKKGEVSGLRCASLGGMSPEERQIAGPALNALKDGSGRGHRGEARARSATPRSTRGCAGEWLDVTLPGRPRRQGTSTRSAR